MHAHRSGSDTFAREAPRRPRRRRVPPVAVGLALVLAPAIALALALALMTRTPALAPAATTASLAHRDGRTATVIWGRPQRASLNLMRRAVADEAGRTQRGLAPCERQPRPATQIALRAGYRACAFLTLARTGASGRTNGTMLLNLGRDGDAPSSCATLIGALAGTSLQLGQIAEATLREVGSTAWADLRAESRAIRGAANEARRVARSQTWSVACRSPSLEPHVPRA
jgi:hypothetical protein